MLAFSALSPARLLVIIVCACVLSLMAQGQVSTQSGPSVASGPAGGFYPGKPSSPDGKTYSLSGTVVNSQTGEGIAHALVQMNQLVTMTDSNGSFTFDGVPQGSYFLSAQKPGFFNQPSPGSRPGATAQVGPDAQPVSLSLSPEAVIFGRITDSDGLPVQRLNVQVMRSAVTEGRRQWLPMGVKETDVDGYYRIASLQPGTYLVVAGPSQMPSIGAMAKTGQQNSGYGVVYFPSPDVNGGTGGIRITPGQKITADMTVDAEQFYSITGVLNAPQGSGVWFNMTPRDNLHVDRGQSIARGDDNTFHIRMIPPGDYILHAGTQVQGKQWNAEVPLHVAGDISGMPVVLEPSVSIPITTTVQRTQTSQSQQNVAFTRFAGPPLQVVLRSIEDDQRTYYANYRQPQQPGEAAGFTVENIQPGTYKAELRPFSDLYVASARYGSTDLLRENLIVSHYGGSDSIDITLRDDGGKVKASISSQGEKANGNLLVVPDHGTPFQPQGLIYNGQGQITLPSLRPGSYSILAFDDLNDLEYSNPAALEPYMSKAAHVDLSANQETDITLELIKRGGQ